nr:hypothetical protein [uncultured Methanolobus sp.]
MVDKLFDLDKILELIPEKDKTLAAIFGLILLGVILTSGSNVQVSLLLVALESFLLAFILLRHVGSDEFTKRLEVIEKYNSEVIICDLKFGNPSPFIELKRKESLLSDYKVLRLMAISRGKIDFAKEIEQEINELKSDIEKLKL